MEAYTGFAEVYDVFQDNVPYEEWCSYVTGLLKEYQVMDGLVLDLGCGTGSLTGLMARSGYDMIGIDNSGEMLQIAMNKRNASGLDILYLLQDMRGFELYGTVKAVISICDSMNYIMEYQELVEVFRLVNNYLDPKGVFIFDLNTEYKYRELLADNTFAEDREESSFIWNNFYDEEDKVNEYDLTLFVKEGELYRKFEETHYQRAYSLEEIKQAICRALEMPEQEQLKRLQHMQKIISVQTVNKWAADFVSEWSDTCRKNEQLRKKRISAGIIGAIKMKYNQAKQRLILLDYDGTLASLNTRPENAKPTPELIATLQKLVSDPANHVVVNSGRDHFTLEKWLGNLPIAMAAEHGAFYKENGIWHKNINKAEWSSGLVSILKLFVEKTPRSHLEVKETTLAWHYRESDAWLGALRAQQLINVLVNICIQQKLQIIQGDKVVEIKSPDYNKGSEVRRQLEKKHYDFIIAMGDDTTDEDMFKALPVNAVTIKVGYVSEAASYNMPSQTEVLPFLQILANKKDMKQPIGENVKTSLKGVYDFFRDLLKTK